VGNADERQYTGWRGMPETRALVDIADFLKKSFKFRHITPIQSSTEKSAPSRLRGAPKLVLFVTAVPRRLQKTAETQACQTARISLAPLFKWVALRLPGRCDLPLFPLTQALERLQS
jgi:hypothetical protein